MSNLCQSCDHLVIEHPNLGRCQGDCLDPESGEFYQCICPVFDKDPDE